MESPDVEEGPGGIPFVGRSVSPPGMLDAAVVVATGDLHGPVGALFLETTATRGDKSCHHACD